MMNKDSFDYQACLTQARSQDLQEGLRWKDECKDFLEYCIPAVRGEYEAWLKGYLRNGGKITHVYDYPWEQWRWFVALTDLKIKPRYGARSVQIIVPKGINVKGEPGHTELYFMDGFRNVGGLVPIFSDMK